MTSPYARSTAAPAGRWQDRAVCRALPPAVFDPPVGDWDAVRAAKGLCRVCPVAVTCLREAMAEEGGMGAQHRATIRGGYTPEERVAIHRTYAAARRAATPTPTN
ncbi:WhiB family transcriptional regulator [Streptomyces sp. DSM 44915]|uniref:WhiB family transcriptional regulator n=1 Tax=Streptomyces chisholmiae TaxID=3075540 RepID=A0ABU2K0V3_9ACTN|nr:WhiB family transcriptional regulator [Streptomyces sp. DSM 44915]MDT0270613.1 WhiB family transcriptional regulator [Streptomyces sp. DSM 44915]